MPATDVEVKPAVSIKLRFKAAQRLTRAIEDVQKTVAAAMEVKTTANTKRISAAQSTISPFDITSYDAFARMGEGTREVSQSQAKEIKSDEEPNSKAVATRKKKVHGVQLSRISKLSKPLEDGLYIVRDIGNGKYEHINLLEIRLKTLQSKGAGALGLDKNLNRANAFYFRGHQWTDIIEKCALASRYSNKHIFEFQKLPIELRYKVYDLVALSEKGIGPRTIFSKPSQSFKILHLNRQIRYDVLGAYDFFKKNQVFFQDGFRKGEPFMKVPISIANRIQELTYEWEGRFKEIPWISYIGKTLPSLKILHIDFNYNLTHIHLRDPTKRSNKLYQDNETIKKFSVIPGFDKLVAIRGLDRVTLSGPPFADDLEVVITEAETKTFEEFLNNVMTLPKPIPISKRTRLPRPPKGNTPAIQ